MAPTEMPYINPLHVAFALQNLPSTIELERLFELLEGIDLLDRGMLIDLTAFALGGTTFPEFPQDEDLQEFIYKRFRKHCEDLPAMDHLVIHAVVLDILNTHRKWSDAHEADSRARLLEGYAEFVKDTPDIDAEKWKREAEACRATKQSDLQVSRRRYDEFCEKAVAPLLNIR